MKTTATALRASTITAAAWLAFAAALPAPALADSTTTEPATFVPHKREVLRNEGIAVTVGGEHLMSMQVDGVPFSHMASVVAVKPGWTGTVYYARSDYRLLSRSCIERAPGGGDGPSTATLDLTPRDGGFDGELRVMLQPGRRVRVEIDAEMTLATGGEFEHQLAAPLGGWMAARPFTAKLDGGTSTGVFPSQPWSDQLEGSTLFSRLRELSVDGRGTTFTIRVDGPANVSLLDYRLNRWNEGLPIYYLGALKRPLKQGERLSYAVTFDFGPPAATAPAATVRTAPVRELADALAVEAPRDLVIPTPKKVVWGDDVMPLPPGEPLGAAGPDAEAAAGVLAEHLRAEYGVNVGVAARTGTAKGVLFRIDPKADLPAEGYRISVGADTATAEAATTAGLRHAAHTLCQLVRVADGRSVGLRRCTVEDWPTFPWRGIHMYSNPSGDDFQIRMLRDIMGPHKINQLLYSSEYIRWNSHPEISHPERGMEQADVRRMLAEAARQAIEVTPLINSFGHSHWLYQNDHYRHLADNPDNPRTYDPTKPEVYRLVEEIYEEAIALFRPRMFHVGKDEIDQYGFPEGEESRKHTTTEWMRRDILHWHKFVTERGMRTAVWSDMFLAGSEANSAASAPNTTESRARRANLPKDVMMFDWHYVPAKPAGYKSVPLWLDEGFDTVVCPWDKPANIVTIAKAAANERAKAATAPAGRGEALGLLQTTWAGYSNDTKAFMAHQKQFQAYLLAAEAAWTGGADSVDEVPFDYAAEFTRIWLRSELPRAGAPGWTTDLGGVANFDLGDEANARWLGYASASTLAALPTGPQRFGRVQFMIPGGGGRPACVLLAGKFNPPGEWPTRVDIPVGRRATTLALLTAATLPGPPIATLGGARVVLSDGTSQTITWKLGETVFPMDQTESLVYTPCTWNSPAAAANGDKPFALHTCLWTNPRPEARVERIEITSSQQGPALMLFGVAGIEAAK